MSQYWSFQKNYRGKCKGNTARQTMRAALLKSAKRRRRARQWQPDQRPRQLTSPPDTGDGSPAAYDTLSGAADM